MVGATFRSLVRSLIVAALVLCAVQQDRAQVQAEEGGPFAVPEDDGLLLPDGRPLPETPVHLSGEWENDDFRIVVWDADLAFDGGEFAGKITFPALSVVLPLTVQGTRTGDIVEFSIRAQESEVAYFAGHLAGTSLVGTFEGIGGKSGEWAGSWFPATLEVDDGIDVGALPPELGGETQ